MNKIRLSQVVICEGRYDKIKLDAVLDAEIITLEGFGIFNNVEKRRLIMSLAEKRGIIVVTDSDSAGSMLRSHINNITRGKGVEHVYIPPTEGKEKRKNTPSKEGLLGVEGIDVDTLRALFERFEDESFQPANAVSRMRFYDDGFSGTEDAKSRREKLAEVLRLPRNMSTKALLSAINMLISLEEYERILEDIK